MRVYLHVSVMKAQILVPDKRKIMREREKREARQKRINCITI